MLNGEGEIVTNAHVVTTGEGEAIRRAEAVYVEFADGNRVAAKVLGHDPNADIALLRVDPKGLSLRPLPLGDSETVKVGEPVAAIGSPFGQAQSLSVGIVSAIDRAVASLTEFSIAGAIQTDAAINPGNSGGPLVGSDGRVIGVNQQIQSRSGGGEGVGFAVPIDIVKRSVDQLRESGKAAYAYLGVSSVPLYPQLVDHFDLKVSKGAWLQTINDDSPAAAAGLRGGNGQEVFQGSHVRARRRCDHQGRRAAGRDRRRRRARSPTSSPARRPTSRSIAAARRRPSRSSWASGRSATRPAASLSACAPASGRWLTRAWPTLPLRRWAA